MIPESVILIGVVGYFLLGWRVSVTTNKIAWVDFFWSSSFFVIVLLFALQKPFTDLAVAPSLEDPLFWGMAGLFSLWSLRLSSHLFRRLRHQPEDPRYLVLSEQWRKHWQRNVLLLYLFEALLALVLSTPLLIGFKAPSMTWQWPQWLSLMLFLMGLLGESSADRQLRIFKKTRTSQSQVCDVGLWRYSRHPNYFFEIVIWSSFAVYCLNLPWGLWAWCPVAIMTFLLVKVTGVAPSEKQALATKGDAYRVYQQRTSMLVPWPPKES